MKNATNPTAAETSDEILDRLQEAHPEWEFDRLMEAHDDLFAQTQGARTNRFERARAAREARVAA